MVIFEWTLALLLGAVILTGLSRRLNAPYPVLLALAGAALALIPSGPEIHIEPDLALALFIAPVLLDSAYDTSPRDLKRNALPLISLVIVAVIVTTAAVAWLGVAWAGLPLAAAIALGAIVAPPDASAAAAILSDIRLPRRVQHILQGESLLNDATAILIYRMAVVAAAGGLTLGHVAPLVLLAAVGSPIAGFVLGRAYLWATRHVTDPASAAILTFVGTFGVWILAERTGLSAIVTTVVYAMTLARGAPRLTGARSRVSTYSVWETAVFTLNVLAFVLMGLQARPILERLAGDSLGEALAFGGAVLVVVILVRIAYVMSYNGVIRVKNRLVGVALPEGMSAPTWRTGLLVSWSGMRGLVTLATAFALPQDFPERDRIVLAAFIVVLGTLILQGATLKPLVKTLGLEAGTDTEQEVSRGRQTMLEAGLAALDGDGTSEGRLLRQLLEGDLKVAANVEDPQGSTAFDTLRLKIIGAQRARLHELRDQGEIGDDAYHRLVEELDWSELDSTPHGGFAPLTT